MDGKTGLERGNGKELKRNLNVKRIGIIFAPNLADIIKKCKIYICIITSSNVEQTKTIDFVHLHSMNYYCLSS